jgi:hypothetical protein
MQQLFRVADRGRYTDVYLPPSTYGFGSRLAAIWASDSCRSSSYRPVLYVAQAADKAFSASKQLISHERSLIRSARIKYVEVFTPAELEGLRTELGFLLEGILEQHRCEHLYHFERLGG